MPLIFFFFFFLPEFLLLLLKSLGSLSFFLFVFFPRKEFYTFI